MLNISVHYGIQIALSMRSHSITIIIGKGKKKKTLTVIGMNSEQGPCSDCWW